MSPKKGFIKDCVHEEVMDKIHNDDVHMRPKIYFIAGSALLGIGVAGSFVIASFFTNILLYKLRYEDAFAVFNIGAGGLQPFILIFPWEPFAIALAGLGGGAILLRRYDFCYQRGVKAVMIGFIALVGTLAFVLDRTGTNEMLHKQDAFKMMYNGERSDKPWIKGTVVDTKNSQIHISTPYRDDVVLHFAAGPTPPVLKSGHVVRALGTWRDGIFVVRYIKILPTQ